MKFINNLQSAHELTYRDVFLTPQKSDIQSRFDVDLTPTDALGTTIPVIVANMNAVAGKRMAEAVARRGGLVVLPQDMPYNELKATVEYVKSRHLVYETPLLLTPNSTIADAMNIIHKRTHGIIIIIDDKNRPVGIFQEADGVGHDRFTPIHKVMSTDLVTLSANMSPKQAYETLHKKRVSAAPVIKGSQVIGVMTQKSALRSDIYRPATNGKGQMLTAVAVGISGDVATKVESALNVGVDVVVLDTAHGHQQKMIKAIKSARSVAKGTPLVAGNVVTAQAVADLSNAGADIIKVGVGPGAMCTTRVMTGVGRPQFSAVLECAKAALELGKHVWADGGIRFPRDVALALAAGASSVMWGSMWAGTYESVSDVLIDNEGRLYKENYGMASKRAVKDRNGTSSLFEQAKKEIFEEGISHSKAYLNHNRPGAEDIIDWVISGLRSAMTYSGARNLDEFHKKAVVGVQTTSGYEEGQALKESWMD